MRVTDRSEAGDERVQPLGGGMMRVSWYGLLGYFSVRLALLEGPACGQHGVIDNWQPMEAERDGIARLPRSLRVAR
jgi:hypothetical protein